ncbi:unnamed protein product [Candida verbasci]|uniref:Uncharacterized protein n=1 Tax=Candida verbasci TaxID=1227364 RepID=A0A9W4XBJ0_9ASCO|nr:unnamed protein product [Candida verbasci]
MSLFINDDDNDDDEGIFNYDIHFESPNKKQKVTLEEADFDIDTENLNDSDFEDVNLDGQENQPQEFTINLSLHKQKLKHLIQQKKQRVSLQYLSMISYILHAKFRNNLLSDRKVLKVLRKMVPDSFNKHYKKFKKNGNDELLVYLIKYLIKWFRKNFKHDSNGIRVLGYQRTAGEYPNNAKHINNVSDLISIIKKFQHNRDTGAQIFTAVLRSLGFEARLVFSLPLLSMSRTTKTQPKLDASILKANKDNDLLYPYFWTELINPLDHSELFVVETQCFFETEKHLIRLKRFNSKKNLYTPEYYPNLNQFCQMSMHYVLAFNNDNLIIDVSPRYMKNIAYRYFKLLDLRTDLGKSSLLLQSLIRIMNRRRHYTNDDYMELTALLNISMNNVTIPETYSAMKKSLNFATQDSLRSNEVIPSGIEPLKIIKFNNRSQPVYFKDVVITGKSEQQWKFLGRSIKPHEIGKPIKSIIASPRTINNRRIFNQNQLEDPNLNYIQLYSFSQTCPYIKPRVDGAIIPRNRYGNIEIFRDTMIPEKCIWLQLSDIENILKFKFQYVPVVVGFIFKENRAIPKKSGVLILKSDEIEVKKFWLTERIKQCKLEALEKNIHLLNMWYKFIKTLRVKKHLDNNFGYV